MKMLFINRRGCLRVLLAVVVLSVISTMAQSGQPKYIFFMIGDGMGVNQVEIAHRYRKLTSQDGSGLIFKSFPVHSKATTNPVDAGKITDSAASGTALACGFKTKNGIIGMDPDFKTGRSVAFEARDCGRAVAVISSVGINHATPAAFYAHQKKRNMYDAIGSEIARCNFEFLAGEPLLGKNHNQTRAIIKAAGYTLLSGRDGLADFDKHAKVMFEQKIPYQSELRKDSIRLADLVRAGLKKVGDSPSGCFMMVEGGKIDWACHANDFGAMVGETLEFDDAVRVVYDFYLDHPEETLIVVTADHETGDLKYDSSLRDDQRFIAQIADIRLTSDALADKIKDWSIEGDHAEIAARALAVSGVNDATGTELRAITEIVKVVRSENKKDQRAKELKRMYGNRNAIVIACHRLVAERCGASFNSFGHTSAMVPVMAIGPGSAMFIADTDNAEIGRKLIQILN
jgi:alkaline phosphatase